MEGRPIKMPITATTAKAMRDLLREITNNAGFATQNAENGNERAVIKYQALSAEAAQRLLARIDDLEEYA